MKKNIALLALTVAALTAMPALTQAQDTPPPAKKHHAGGQAIHGKVSAEDTTAMTVTVGGKGGDKTYTVTSETKIMKDGAPATFADIKVGEFISGAYKLDGDKMIATRITIIKPKKKSDQ